MAIPKRVEHRASHRQHHPGGETLSKQVPTGDVANLARVPFIPKTVQFNFILHEAVCAARAVTCIVLL
jgi:hypothetical protein